MSTTPTQVRPGMTSYGTIEGGPRFLSDVIIELGLAEEEHVTRAVQDARLSRANVGQILVQEGRLTEDDLARALAARYGLSHIDLTEFEVDPEAANLLPPAAAQRYKAVPLAFEADGSLLVAMADPSDSLALSDITFMTHLDVKAAVAATNLIEGLAQRLPLAPKESGGTGLPVTAPEAPAPTPEPLAEPVAEAAVAEPAPAPTPEIDTAELDRLRAELDEANAALTEAKARVHGVERCARGGECGARGGECGARGGERGARDRAVGRRNRQFGARHGALGAGDRPRRTGRRSLRAGDGGPRAGRGAGRARGARWPSATRRAANSRPRWPSATRRAANSRPRWPSATRRAAELEVAWAS